MRKCLNTVGWNGNISWRNNAPVFVVRTFPFDFIKCTPVLMANFPATFWGELLTSGIIALLLSHIILIIYQQERSTHIPAEETKPMSMK